MSSKILRGHVVSNKLNKTVIVSVETAKKHNRYDKRYLSHKKYKAHCDDNTQLKENDLVVIQECRPMSRDKRFKVIKVIK